MLTPSDGTTSRARTFTVSHDPVFRKRREDRTIDLAAGREHHELPLELSGHRVERRGEVLELVAASDRDRVREVTFGDPQRAFTQLT